MKIFIFTFLLLFVFLSNVSARDKAWYKHSYENRITVEDVLMMGGLVILNFGDYLQTQYIVAHPDKYFETNKYLGKHPSASDVDKYFLISTAIQVGVWYILPKKFMFGEIELRPRGSFVIYEAGKTISALQHNNSIGVKYEWRW